MWADRHVHLALAGGVAFWLGMWLMLPLQPVSVAQFLSGAYLYLALATPVLEELAFRGALMGWFRDYAWGRTRILGVSRANLMASVLFTAIHFAYHPPIWAAAVFIPSLLFGHLRDRHSSVWPPIVVHVFYNAGYFALAGVPAVG